jgi:hypothetical protein
MKQSIRKSPSGNEQLWKTERKSKVKQEMTGARSK